MNISQSPNPEHLRGLEHVGTTRDFSTVYFSELACGTYCPDNFILDVSSLALTSHEWWQFPQSSLPRAEGPKRFAMKLQSKRHLFWMKTEHLGIKTPPSREIITFIILCNVMWQDTVKRCWTPQSTHLRQHAPGLAGIFRGGGTEDSYQRSLDDWPLVIARRNVSFDLFSFIKLLYSFSFIIWIFDSSSSSSSPSFRLLQKTRVMKTSIR